MKNKTTILIIVLVVLLGITGTVVYKALQGTPDAPLAQEEEIVAMLPPVDSSVIVNVKKSKSATDTVVMEASGLAKKMVSIGYELSYDSEGLIKGVNSGSKPIDVTGKDTFEREIYLGTCSRNVCKADTGVTSVSLVLEFTDKDGKKSQFSKDFEL